MIKQIKPLFQRHTISRGIHNQNGGKDVMTCPVLLTWRDTFPGSLTVTDKDTRTGLENWILEISSCMKLWQIISIQDLEVYKSIFSFMSNHTDLDLFSHGTKTIVYGAEVVLSNKCPKIVFVHFCLIKPR